MKLKSFSLVALISGVILVVIGVIAPIIIVSSNYGSMDGGIGIIGGAGAPTYQFAFGSLPFCLMMLGASLSISALFCLIFPRIVVENCTLKTSLISLGLSSVSALGLVCFFTWYSIVAFHEMSKHPISYPVSMILGAVCFIVFVALAVLYFKSRKICWSVKGFVIDVLFGILYSAAFFFAFSLFV